MKDIYQAMYVCKFVTSIGLPGYNNVLLGLSGGNGDSDILIKGTLARFVEGREYLIRVSEL